MLMQERIFMDIIVIFSNNIAKRCDRNASNDICRKSIFSTERSGRVLAAT